MPSSFSVPCRWENDRVSEPIGGAPIVLGIESSCDETGVGNVRGTELLGHAVASSVDEHARFVWRTVRHLGVHWRHCVPRSRTRYWIASVTWPGPTLSEHKIGQRHVQGRTKAGGQSQQRFARRRDNQARAAYEAAADHAARILSGPPLLVVTGGDHAAVDDVLTDPRLRHLTVTAPWLAVPDPRRKVLDAAVVEASALRLDVVNA